MFIYEPLGVGSPDIRLVRLRPVDVADVETAPIHLDICHASLNDNNLCFTALSYTWGDQKSPLRILLNDEPFSISQNLHAALFELRRQQMYSWIWIDSICIHQSDGKEKAHQVGLMHKIYSQADIVHIWLGPGNRESDKAMDFFARIGPRAVASGASRDWHFMNSTEREEIHDYIKTCSPSSADTDEATGSKEGSELARFIFDLLMEPGMRIREHPWTQPDDEEQPNDDVCHGIANIMRRDYWHRIWIIQEISLSRNGLVMCGSKTVSLEFLDETITAISQCKRLGISKLRSDTHDFGRGLFANFDQNIALTIRRDYRRNRARVRLPEILVHDVLPPYRPFYSASDPRDIVFGLLGLITDEEALGLQADYSLKPSEVFTALTRALISDGFRRRSKFSLTSCTPRGEKDNDLNLPTWVPDWRKMGQHGLRVWPIERFGHWDATPGMPVPPLLTGYPPAYGILASLSLRGCHVDVITRVMEPPEYLGGGEYINTSIRNVDVWLANIAELAELGPDSGPAEDYVWRTALLDCDFGLSRPLNFALSPLPIDAVSLLRKIMRKQPMSTQTLTKEEIEYVLSVKSYQNWPGLDNLDAKLDFVCKRLPGDMGSRTRGRTLFKTVKGMFGQGHVAIRAGDVVTLLWGMKSPIILRPLENSEGNTEYTFVGDAYVDGIMNGEFLKTMPTHRDFNIH